MSPQEHEKLIKAFTAKTKGDFVKVLAPRVRVLVRVQVQWWLLHACDMIAGQPWTWRHY